MSDIKNEIYKSESEHLAISLYRIDTLQQLIHSMQEEKEKFITTIESLQEELKLTKFNLDIHIKAVGVEYETRYQLDEANNQIESQKEEITALKKSLQRIVFQEDEGYE